MKRIIVSRHPAAVEFIRRELPQFALAPVGATATAEDVAGAEVAGNLPLDLAAEAEVVYALLFAGAPPRGQEYSLAEMIEAGAYIRAFRVRPVPLYARCPGCETSPDECTYTDSRIDSRVWQPSCPAARLTPVE